MWPLLLATVPFVLGGREHVCYLLQPRVVTPLANVVSRASNSFWSVALRLEGLWHFGVRLRHLAMHRKADLRIPRLRFLSHWSLVTLCLNGLLPLGLVPVPLEHVIDVSRGLERLVEGRGRCGVEPWDGLLRGF